MRRRILSLRFMALLLLVLGFTSPAAAILFYTFLPSNGAGYAFFRPPRHIKPADIAVPPGYCIEPVITGLTFPSSVVTDEQDRVYVLEAGYSYGEDFAPPRLLRLEADGQVSTIAIGDANAGPWNGMSYHQEPSTSRKAVNCAVRAASCETQWTGRSRRWWTGCPARATTTPTGRSSGRTVTSTSGSARPRIPAWSARITPSSAG